MAMESARQWMWHVDEVARIIRVCTETSDAARIAIGGGEVLLQIFDELFDFGWALAEHLGEVRNDIG